MIKRTIEALISRYAGEYPAVTVLGPRQAGKSTTVRELFPTHSHANLEVRETRLLAETDARAFFSPHPANPVLPVEIPSRPPHFPFPPLLSPFALCPLWLSPLPLPPSHNFARNRPVGNPSSP